MVEINQIKIIRYDITCIILTPLALYLAIIEFLKAYAITKLIDMPIIISICILKAVAIEINTYINDVIKVHNTIGINKS